MTMIKQFKCLPILMVAAVLFMPHPTFAADKSKKSNAPFQATFTCTVQGQTTQLLACIIDSSIKVTTEKGVKIYFVADLAREGSRWEKVIPLTERFHIEASNSASSRYMILNLKIENRKGKIIFQDSVTPYGWINVEN